jgi:phage gpG-like protein
MTLRFGNDNIKLDGLERLTKAIGDKNPPHVRLGVLGQKSTRTAGGEATNADIGATHEYGSPAKNIPQRSFLRLPAANVLPGKLESSHAFGDKALKEVVAAKSIKPWMEKIGKLGEEVVKEAFATEGWGTWKKWSKSYARRKKKGTDNMILDDTGQLRDSITSDVV